MHWVLLTRLDNRTQNSDELEDVTVETIMKYKKKIQIKKHQ